MFEREILATSKGKGGAITKKYILVVVNTVSYLHNLILLDDMTAKTFAKRYFEEHVCYYSAPRKIVMDRGANFLGDVSKELYALLSIPIRVVSAANPRANGYAEAGVGRFSRALKAVLGGQNILQWRSRLNLIKLIL